MKLLSKREFQLGNMNAYLRTSLIFSLFVAFRGGTRDTQVYADTYYSIINFPWDPIKFYSDFGMEWAYGFFSWGLNSINADVTFLFFIISYGTFYFIGRVSQILDLNPFSIMPFYLGSFFLIQQLMQIRQGFAVTLAYFLVFYWGFKKGREYLTILFIPLMSIFHVTASLIPFIYLINKLFNRLFIYFGRRLFLVLYLFLTIAFSYYILNSDQFLSFEKIQIFLNSEELSSKRSLFDLINIKSMILFILTLLLSSEKIIYNNKYYFLLLLFTTSLAVRIGFIDFSILSGRFGSALGFSEIFIIPLLLQDFFKNKFYIFFLSCVYLLASIFITLSYQAPYLLDDYFTPLL